MVYRGIVLLLTMLCSSAALGAEFAAAIGRKGSTRCHAYYCGFFIIDYAMPVGDGPDGTLYAIYEHTWAKPYTDDKSQLTIKHPEKQEPSASLVYCSKTRPVVFNFFEGWEAISLRPGDEESVMGRTEAAYKMYYAACHNAIVQAPNPPGLAKRLGYSFANGGGGETDDDKLKPADLLRSSPASRAAPAAKAIADCTKLKKAVERLTCYDTAAGLSE